MKIFSVYLDKKNNLESAIFIKDGFSFKAFFFNYLWLLFHRMWFPLIILTLFNFIITASCYTGNIDLFFCTVISAIISLYLGFAGVQLKELSLIKRGYKFKDSIVARNQREAQLKFFNFMSNRLLNPDKK